MSFDTHTPERTPFAAIATGVPTDVGQWTGQGPPTPRWVTTLIGMPGLHGSRPHTPAYPYRPRTRRSRSARVPWSVRRRRRRTGGIRGAVRWCLRSFGTESLVGDVASLPLPHRVAERQRLPSLERRVVGECQIFLDRALPVDPDGFPRIEEQWSPSPATSKGRRKRGEGLQAVFLAREGAITRAYMETLGLWTQSFVGGSPEGEPPFR